MASPYFLYALLLLHFSVVLANFESPPAPAPLPPSHRPIDLPRSHPFPRFKVVVQGVVYCKSCKYIGEDTLMGAAPLVGAEVKLQCGYVTVTAETDKNGYFFFMQLNRTPFNSRKCKVFLVSSPLPTCNVATNLHDGATGATPMPSSETYKPWALELFNVGPFAFEPSKEYRCH